MSLANEETGCGFAILAVVIGFLVWQSAPDTSLYCRADRPGFLDDLLGRDAQPVCSDVITRLDRRIAAQEGVIADLEERLELVDGTVESVAGSQENLRRTFNQNVDIDNGRNDALRARINRLRTRAGECGYRYGVVNGIYQSTPIECE